MISQWQSTDVMPEELVTAIGRIVAGCVMRYFPGTDIEEVTQRVLLLVLRRKGNFDPSRNLFAYLSTLVLNEIRLHHRERITWAKRHEQFPEDVQF